MGPLKCQWLTRGAVVGTPKWRCLSCGVHVVLSHGSGLAAEHSRGFSHPRMAVAVGHLWGPSNGSTLSVGPAKWRRPGCGALRRPSANQDDGGDGGSSRAPGGTAAPRPCGLPEGGPRAKSRSRCPRGRNRNPQRGRAGTAPSAGRGGGSSPGRRGEAVPRPLPPPPLPPPGPLPAPLPAPRRAALPCPALPCAGGATCRCGGAALGRAARPAPQVGSGELPVRPPARPAGAGASPPPPVPPRLRPRPGAFPESGRES